MWGDDSEICICKVKTNCGEGIWILNIDTYIELTSCATDKSDTINHTVKYYYFSNEMVTEASYIWVN